MTLLLVPVCFLAGMEAASCEALQDVGTGGVEEGQSSVCILSSGRKYPFPYHKRKTIVFMVSRKKSNNGAHAQDIAGDEGRYRTRKVAC
jgi:hypothetical protein